jgi:hypothetical protein
MDGSVFVQRSMSPRSIIIVRVGFAPGRPHNGFAERLIGSIRRKCTDHIFVLGQEHLPNAWILRTDQFCERELSRLDWITPKMTPVQ